MIREKNLFFSYAGRSDTFFERFAPCCPIHNEQTHRETFTDRLYNELNRRISVYKMEDNYTGDIDSFRRKIADSRYVIIVLSHKYLMSPQCMIEWHEIHSREDWTSKSIWYIVYDEEQVKTKDGKHKYDIPTFDFLYADKQYYDELIVPTWRNRTKQTHRFDESKFSIFFYFVSPFITLSTSEIGMLSWAAICSGVAPKDEDNLIIADN